MRSWIVSSVHFLWSLHNPTVLIRRVGHCVAKDSAGSISIKNRVCEPVTKRGILDYFDLARFGRQEVEPSGKDNTGTMPLTPLDPLGDRTFKGPVVWHQYQNDAQFFAWCPVHGCICVEKGRESQIRTIITHPLRAQFENLDSRSRAKSENQTRELLNGISISLHRRYKRLALGPRMHWVV